MSTHRLFKDESIIIRCGACHGKVNFSSDYCSHCKSSFYLSVHKPGECLSCQSLLIKGGPFGLKCEVCKARPYNLDKAKNGALIRRTISTDRNAYFDFEGQNHFFEEYDDTENYGIGKIIIMIFIGLIALGAFFLFVELLLEIPIIGIPLVLIICIWLEVASSKSR